jgi:hypothetical protein
MGRTELKVGARVRRAATGEDGVVLSVGDGALVEVAFASGAVWVPEIPEVPTPRQAPDAISR